MAAIASPTPLSFNTTASEFRRPSRPVSRTAAYPRAYALRATHDAPSQARRPRESSGDSSDDDDLAPIKLSAEAQAILGEDNSQAGSDRENNNIYGRRKSAGFDQMPDGGVGSVGPMGRFASNARGTGSPAPRIVRLPQTRPAALTSIGRDGSFMYKTHDKTNVVAQESNTPPSRRRIIRVDEHRRSSRSPPSNQSAGSHEAITTHEQEALHQAPASPEPPERVIGEDEIPIGPSTVSRPRRVDENGVHSTMRVRRIGVGSMLGKPVRRGMIRRPSDDDAPQYEREPSLSPEIEVGRRAKEPEMEDVPDLAMSPSKSPAFQPPETEMNGKRSRSPSSKRTGSPQPRSPVHQAVLSTSLHRSKPTPASNGSHPSTKSSNSQQRPVFKIPSLPPVSVEHEQENEPPPTFKKSKSSTSLLEIHEDGTESKRQQSSKAEGSPMRQALAPRSNNTPHRPAPAPPPKMSLIEAATSNPNPRKKGTVTVVINGRQYKRLDCVGRGGSSRVYRVMADNYKILALKRVNLEDADEAAVIGYKGEIDLLRRLEKVDRVIKLMDYEINNDKGILQVLMELGETDFNKMLNEQCKSEGARLDVTFTRHYWKEMLECVHAVHEHGIVHSDLKPANFLLVKGQLKLIDFGIANAIQDNTVNVHRENQIGTPNYMSPESLICQNVTTDPSGQQIKDIKLGKPSDVWSLGCILYQMTYGQPPFAHITQQMQKILSIPNPKVEISFPARGIGGVVVPFGLIKTLRRCLQREQSLRPTIPELLAEADPFLNPVAISPDMLGRVIGNVVSYCRRREENMKKEGQLGGLEGGSCLPKDDEMRGWPLAFYEKLRQAQEEGTAW